MDQVTWVDKPRVERLFDEDAYLKEFDAVVTSIRREKDAYWVALDRTAFFPEGGGQDGDTGRLSGEGYVIPVTDTREDGGQIWHKVRWTEPLEELPAPGEGVHGEIDWQERFDRMQNHSGEHIVSGLIHRRYGYENVGFHMGKGFITIDLSGPLTMEQLSLIEEEANQVVWSDIKTAVRTYPSQELGDLSYRSKKELIGDVRIVTFPGTDVCACCGTHVSSTGQIGLIKILSCSTFHDGVRVEMICGGRAMAYLNQIWRQNHQVSVELSAKPLETAEAVRRLKNTSQQTAFQFNALAEQSFQEKARSFRGKGNVLLFEQALTPELVRKLSVAVMEECGGISLVFSGTDAEGYKYAIGRKEGDVRELVRKLNASLAGRGGGKPFFAQGSVQASRKRISAWVQEALSGEVRGGL